MKKVIFIVCVVLAIMVTLASCRAADTASWNVSRAADSFEINRRIVFFNGITDEYLLVIEGRSSIVVDSEEGQLEVIVQTGVDEYKKHFLGLSDNVTYFVEQLDPAEINTYHYKVIFRPEVIIPDIDIDTSN